MAWHRTIVSLLIAVTTVLALLYMSTLAPEVPAGVQESGATGSPHESDPHQYPASVPEQPGQRLYAIERTVMV